MMTISPRVNKLVCRTVLMNMGWLSHRSIAGTAANEEEKQDDDEKVPPPSSVAWKSVPSCC